jgi:hypothetical protein
MLAYIITAAFYSITEAGFRVLGPSWIFLVLAVVCASGVSAGLFGGKASKILASAGGTGNGTSARNELWSKGKADYAARLGLADFGIDGANDLQWRIISDS